jgi:hypothetical protein
MSMDFETVRFLRILFALIFAAVGAAAGIKYGQVVLGSLGTVAGPVVGVLVGAVFGWNTVDWLKGRAQKF